MRKMRHLLLAMLISLATLCMAAPTQAASIWGKEIQKQAFDKKPLHEIVIPDWLQNVPQNTYSVGAGNVYDQAKAVGAQMTDIFFLDPFSVYYDSKYLKERNQTLPKDYCEKKVQELRKRGFRMISGHGPWLQKEIYYSHPEMRAIDANTTQVPYVAPAPNSFGGRLCQLGPWGDMLIDILAEILTKYDVDGFNFDGIHHFGPCYCQSCRDRYRKDTGSEIPNMDLKDAAYRRYLVWEDRQMEGFVERMQKRLKSIKPTVALVTYTTNAGRLGHLMDIPHGMPARMNLLFDAPDQEFWMDETNRGNSVMGAFSNAMIWAVTNQRIAYSSPYIMTHGNPYGDDSFPPQEIFHRTALIMTQGTLPAICVMPQHLTTITLENVKEVNRRAQWLTHKEAEPWAALVMGDYTRQFYGLEAGKVEERYLSNVLGFFRVGIEEHLPVVVINEWNLNKEDLAKYKVLILANTACLSDAQVEAVRDYVKNGGGLVASVDASRFDEMGAPRKDFGLADAFGVHYKGLALAEGSKMAELDPNFLKGVDPTYWAKRKSIFNITMAQHPITDLPRIRQYLHGAAVTFKGQAVLVSADGATTVSSMTVKDDVPTTAPLTATPAVTAREFGKGKVVYMASGLDSGYYLYPYPYQRLLMAQSMRWVASEPPRVSAEAPMCVQVATYRQKKDGERLVVHLCNTFNSSGNHAKPDEDVPLREEVVPVNDIKVMFTNYDISRVHLEPEGIDLPMTREGDKVKVTVPKLEIHSMVVAELGGK